MEKVNIRPLFDRIVLKQLEADVMTKAGIYIPDTVQEKPNKGVILACGPGRSSADPMSLQAGQLVLYTKNAGMEMEYDHDGEKVPVVFMRESDVIAILADNYQEV